MLTNPDISNSNEYFLDEPWRASLIQAIDRPSLFLAVAVWSPLSPLVRASGEISTEVQRDLIALALVALSRHLPELRAEAPHLLDEVHSLSDLLQTSQRKTADSRLIADTKIFQSAFERIIDVETLVDEFQRTQTENERRLADGLPLLPHARANVWMPTMAEALTILGEIFLEYEFMLKRKTQTIRRTALISPLLAAQLLANFLGKTIWAKSERMMPELGNRYPVWIRGKVVRVTTRGIVLEPENANDAATLQKPKLSEFDRKTGSGLLLSPLQTVPPSCEFLHGIDTFPALPPEVEISNSADHRNVVYPV